MSERKSFTFTWRIKNFSFCWQKEEQELSSPIFCVEGLQGSKWRLFLYPTATKCKKWGSIACCLVHESEENDRPNFEIDYEISVLDCNGLPLEALSSTKDKMEAKDWSQALVLKKYEVFLRKRNAFLPKDSLTVRCRIWQNNQENTNAERYFATTRIEVEKALLFGVLKKVNDDRDRYYVEFISASSKISPISMTIKVTETGLDAFILPRNSESVKFCKCRLRFKDGKENVILFGQDEYLCYNATTIPLFEDKPLWIIPMNYTNKHDNTQSNFKLKNLILQGEIEYSIGIVSETIQKVDYSVSMFRNGSRIKQKREKCSSLKDDLLSLLVNGDYSDINLETQNKIFPAHRSILIARSNYFKTELADPNNRSNIYIHDINDDILNQVLLFLYTDNIENLDLEKALKLYIASVQYEIPSLKHKCASFLQNNLSSSISCEVLQAADRYQDSDLKKIAQNYILEHEDEVNTYGWLYLEKFAELKEEIMCLKRMKD